MGYQKDSETKIRDIIRKVRSQNPVNVRVCYEDLSKLVLHTNMRLKTEARLCELVPVAATYRDHASFTAFV